MSGLLYITETGFYSQRPLVHTILGGVFERFPKLKMVLTEMGCAWIPGLLAQLDGVINSIRSTRSIGELRYTDDQVLNHTATEYVQRNVWVGASQPRPPDAAAREVLGDHRFMWGSDYPHDEGTHPFTREHLRQVFNDTPPDELQQILAGNAAELFDFDLDALQSRGRPLRTDGRRDRPAAHRAARRRQPGLAPRRGRDRLGPLRHLALQDTAWRAYATPKREGEGRSGAQPVRRAANQASVAAFQRLVMPQGNAMKPCGMSGATKSSVSLPAAA